MKETEKTEKPVKGVKPGKPGKELEKIEERLTASVNDDMQRWQGTYQMMHQVEQDQMYAGAGYRSFTAWVNHVAERAHCHVSLLWARLKAGRAYAEYAERAKAAGREVPALDDIRVSPDTLGLCVTVGAGSNSDIDHLIDQSVAGKLGRADLRDAARARRWRKSEQSWAACMKKYDDEHKHDDDQDDDQDKDDQQVNQDKESEKPEKPVVTAEQIVLALRRHRGWLGVFNDRSYVDRGIEVYTEMRADTGEGRAVRRFDVLVAETLTCSERDAVKLHGVEIKVSKSDLMRDHKMAEYVPFCDCFYIAVPDVPVMIQAAEDVRLPTWGVLAVSPDGAVRVVEPAQVLPGAMRDKMITSCLIKLMRKV